MNENFPSGSHSVQTIIVRHDAWCPMAYGEGLDCAHGCRPVTEQVSLEEMVSTINRDFKNRAERRAAAKAARKAQK